MSSRVIVADHDRQRIDAVARFLQTSYDIDASLFDGCDSLLFELARATLAEEEVALVILASDLPSATLKKLDAKLEAVFGQPCMMPDGRVVVLQRSGQQRLDIHLNRLDWLPAELSRIDEGALRGILDEHLQVLPLPAVEWDETDLVLGQQLALLNPLGQQNGERSVLQRVLSRFRRGGRAARIDRLRSGHSGSAVFRVDWVDDRGKTETVLLKVSKQEDISKNRRAFDNWDAIETALVHSGLTRNVPTLHRVDVPSKDSAYLVKIAGLYAEFWKFLGEEVGRFADWEEVYWREDTCLPTVEEFLAKVITLLRAAWYDKAVWCNPRGLWTPDDMSQAAAIATPPYGLTSWWKARILASLTELDRLGARMSPAQWQADYTEIRRWICSGPAVGSAATRSESVLLSPIHGDLNKGNILWWLDESRPLLIDFVTYHQQAHTLQDFAHLEAQVMYALMDRQYSARHRALDYDGERLMVWREAIERMIPAVPTPFPVLVDATGARQDESVKSVAALICLIRRHGEEVFKRAVDRSGHSCPPERFSVEYTAALLFATIRMIGYDSLSPFKRLLAVRNASALIARLNAMSQ